MRRSDVRWIIGGALLVLLAAFLFWWANHTGNTAILGALFIVATALAGAATLWLPYPRRQANKQASHREPDDTDTREPPSN